MICGICGFIDNCCSYYLIAVSREEAMRVIAIVLIFVAVLASAEKARFDLYRLYDVTVETDLHLQLFNQISEYPDGVRRRSR